MCLNANANGDFCERDTDERLCESSSPSSSLHEEVHVVDAQRIEFGVWSLNIQQQPPKRHENLAASTISTLLFALTRGRKKPSFLHIIPIPLAKPVNLPMTHIIILVRQAPLPYTHIPPPFTIVLTPIQIQR
jgi:hypothetical protein